MDILNLLNASAPTGLWASIINWMEGGIANYAVVLILITLMIKVVMLPLDVYNKIISKKNTRMMVAMQPELNKINQRYANNPQIKNQKTAEVYKKHHYNVYGMCFSMLLYMGLTMTIFFTLFGTLNKMSAYKIKEEYNTLKTVYNQTYEEKFNSYDGSLEITAEEYATQEAEKAVVKEYGEIKSGFLWIKSIWRPDTPAKVTLTYKNFIKETGLKKTEVTKEEYQKIMNPIQKEYSGWNGYFLLAILNGALSFGSVYIGGLITKHKAKKNNLPYVQDTNKTMMIVMPIIMAVFTLIYNAAFGIYIVTGSLVSFLTSPLVTLVTETIDYKMQQKEANKHKVAYSR